MEHFSVFEVLWKYRQDSKRILIKYWLPSNGSISAYTPPTIEWNVHLSETLDYELVVFSFYGVRQCSNGVMIQPGKDKKIAIFSFFPSFSKNFMLRWFYSESIFVSRDGLPFDFGIWFSLFDGLNDQSSVFASTCCSSADWQLPVVCKYSWTTYYAEIIIRVFLVSDHCHSEQEFADQGMGCIQRNMLEKLEGKVLRTNG